MKYTGVIISYIQSNWHFAKKKTRLCITENPYVIWNKQCPFYLCHLSIKSYLNIRFEKYERPQPGVFKYIMF